ncbi:hypothetical protein HK101_001375 [Irineochytrium annulatum]|nr:hypothetical protein HK101_001375 [Irineochytrium annulatum]
MQLLRSLAVLASAVTVANGFTVGTLLPGYLCGWAGYPTSLGGVLSYFKEDGAAVTIAGFHNQNATTAQQDIAMTTMTNGVTTIAPGASVSLQVAASGGAEVALVGLLIYAVDDQGAKIGSFSQFPKDTMAAFPGCDPAMTGLPIGIVHTTTLDDANEANPNVQAGLVWQAPAVMYTTSITFKGLAVTDNGFGFHSVTVQTTGMMPGAAPYSAGMGQPQRVLKCSVNPNAPAKMGSGTIVTPGGTVIVTDPNSSAGYGLIGGINQDFQVGKAPPMKRSGPST